MLNALGWGLAVILTMVSAGGLALLLVVPMVYPEPSSGERHTYPYCGYCERESDWTERAEQDGVTLRKTPAWICCVYTLPRWCKATAILAAAVSFILAGRIFPLY